MAQYKIVIDTKGQTKKEKQIEQLETVSPKTGNDKKNTSDSAAQLSSIKTGAVGALAYNSVTGLAKNVGQYTLSTIGVRTDNTVRQNQINNALNLGSQALGIGGWVATGAAFGPWGAAIGAVIGIAEAAVNVVQGAEDYNRREISARLGEVKNSERLGIICTDKNRKR